MTSGGILPMGFKTRRGAAAFGNAENPDSSDPQNRSTVQQCEATPSSAYRCVLTGKVRYPSRGGWSKISVFAPSATPPISLAACGKTCGWKDKKLAILTVFEPFGREADKKTGAVSCDALHLRWRLSHLWALRPAATRSVNRPYLAERPVSALARSQAAIWQPALLLARLATWLGARPRTPAKHLGPILARLAKSKMKPVGWTRGDALPPSLCLKAASAAEGTI